MRGRMNEARGVMTAVATAMLTMAGTMPIAAQACGFNRIDAQVMPTYSSTRASSAEGEVYLFGKVADARLERALKKTGQKVLRGDDRNEASKAKLVIVASADVAKVQGISAALVIMTDDAVGQTEGSGKYVIRDGQTLDEKLAVIDRAVQESTGRL